jgi:hypothetical protein
MRAQQVGAEHAGMGLPVGERNPNAASPSAMEKLVNFHRSTIRSLKTIVSAS